MFCCTFRELQYKTNIISLSLTIQVAKTLQTNPMGGRDVTEQWPGLGSNSMCGLSLLLVLIFALRKLVNFNSTWNPWATGLFFTF